MQKFKITTTKNGYLLTHNNRKLHLFGNLKTATTYARQVASNYINSNLVIVL